MNARHVTRGELDNDLQDVRMERGELLAQIREEWRREIELWKGKFMAEIRLWMLAVIVVLKFHVPDKFTIPAVGLAISAAVGKGLFARFSSH